MRKFYEKKKFPFLSRHASSVPGLIFVESMHCLKVLLNTLPLQKAFVSPYSAELNSYIHMNNTTQFV